MNISNMSSSAASSSAASPSAASSSAASSSAASSSVMPSGSSSVMPSGKIAHFMQTYCLPSTCNKMTATNFKEIFAIDFSFNATNVTDEPILQCREAPTPKPSKGLGPGAIAGIVIGILVGVLLLGFLGSKMRQKESKSNYQAM